MFINIYKIYGVFKSASRGLSDMIFIEQQQKQHTHFIILHSVFRIRMIEQASSVLNNSLLVRGKALFHGVPLMLFDKLYKT